MSKSETNIVSLHTILFFAIMGLASYYSFVNSHTILSHFPFRGFGSVFKVLSLLLSIFLLLGSVRLYNPPKVILIFISAILVQIVAWNSGWEFYGYILWSYYVLIISAKSVNFRSIIKFHFLFNLFLCLINIAGDAMGWTDKSLVYTSDERLDMFGEGVVSRLSVGYPASTDFATHILYLLLDFLILKRGKIQLFGYIVLFVSAYVTFFLCDARQAGLCIILLFLFVFYDSFLNRKKKTFNKWLGYIMACSVVILFFVCLYATLSYDESNLNWVAADIALSGRLHLGLDAIEEFGINWLGNDILLVGAGYSGADLVYNYVDCTYIQFFLRWGIIMMAIILLLFVRTGTEAYKRDDKILLIALFIASISSVTTQFLIDLNYCVFILAITAFHTDEIIHQRDISTV